MTNAKANTKEMSVKKKRKSLSLRKKDQLMGYLFTAPWLIGFIFLVATPLAQSFWYSLNNIKILPRGRKFIYVGFNNYRDVWLKDMFFIQTLVGFLLDTVLRVPVIVVFALLIAMLINGNMKFKGLFRTIYFLPVIIVSGPVMNELMAQGATSVPMMNQTLINNLLGQFLPMWLATPIVSLFQEIIMILWYSGVQILMFLAALQKVDRSLFEAAKMDGGSAWECFWKITLPMLKPMILLNAIYTIVALANAGDNQVISLIYTNMFSATRGYGFASAMAWMYSIIQTLIVIIVFMMLKEKPDKITKKYKKLQKRRIGRRA
jgi:oligogalacturonide transport system permease protein